MPTEPLHSTLPLSQPQFFTPVKKLSTGHGKCKALHPRCACDLASKTFFEHKTSFDVPVVLKRLQGPVIPRSSSDGGARRRDSGLVNLKRLTGLSVTGIDTVGSVKRGSGNLL